MDWRLFLLIVIGSPLPFNPKKQPDLVGFLLLYQLLKCPVKRLAFTVDLYLKRSISRDWVMPPAVIR
jgi:hypothetical protein